MPVVHGDLTPYRRIPIRGPFPQDPDLVCDDEVTNQLYWCETDPLVTARRGTVIQLGVPSCEVEVRMLEPEGDDVASDVMEEGIEMFEPVVFTNQLRPLATRALEGSEHVPRKTKGTDSHLFCNFSATWSIVNDDSVSCGLFELLLEG
jgi:hypothetical protein